MRLHGSDGGRRKGGSRLPIGSHALSLTGSNEVGRGRPRTHPAAFLRDRTSPIFEAGGRLGTEHRTEALGIDPQGAWYHPAGVESALSWSQALAGTHREPCRPRLPAQEGERTQRWGPAVHMTNSCLGEAETVAHARNGRSMDRPVRLEPVPPLLGPSKFTAVLYSFLLGHLARR